MTSSTSAENQASFCLCDRRHRSDPDDVDTTRVCGTPNAPSQNVRLVVIDTRRRRKRQTPGRAVNPLDQQSADLPNWTQVRVLEHCLWLQFYVLICLTSIGGFNQRQREAMPPQIFLTLKFVVCIALKIIEIVATWGHILRLKRHQIWFRLGLGPRPR